MAGWRSARAWAPAVVAVACLGGVALGRLDKVPRPAGGQVHRTPQMSDEGRALLGVVARTVLQAGAQRLKEEVIRHFVMLFVRCIGLLGNV